MAYGSNLITNSSAENGNLDGWSVTPSGSVVIAENQVWGTPRYGVILDDHEGWWASDNYVFMSLTGGAGTYHYLLGANAQMQQTIYASDVGATPVDFKGVLNFQIPNVLTSWDATVKARAEIVFRYTNGIKRIMTIPCQKGVNVSGRHLSYGWVLTEAYCDMNVVYNIDTITITIKTEGLTGGLMVNYIQLMART